MSTCYEYSLSEQQRTSENVLSEIITSYSLLFLFGIVGIVGSGVAIYHSYLHIKNYVKPIQTPILRLLLSAPIYILFLILSYRFTHVDIYLMGLTLVMNSILTTQIINLLICTLEKEELSLVDMVKNRKSLNLIFPLNKFTYLPSNSHFFPLLFACILQYPVIVTTGTLIRFILIDRLGVCPMSLNSNSPTLYLDLIYILSSIIMMYAILVFYHTFGTDLQILFPKKIVWALLILLVSPVYFNFFFSILIQFDIIHGLILFTKESVGIMINNGVQCIFYMILTIYICIMFNPKQYLEYQNNQLPLSKKLHIIFINNEHSSILSALSSYCFQSKVANEEIQAVSSIIMPKEEPLPSLKTLRKISIKKLDHQFEAQLKRENVTSAGFPLNTISSTSISNLSSISSIDFNKTDLHSILFK